MWSRISAESSNSSSAHPVGQLTTSHILLDTRHHSAANKRLCNRIRIPPHAVHYVSLRPRSPILALDIVLLTSRAPRRAPCMVLYIEELPNGGQTHSDALTLSAV